MSKKLDGLVEKIKKTYKMDIVVGDDISKVEKLPLDSCGLNYVFGGGLPLGRIILLHGKESNGKSTLSTYLAMQVQKHYKEKPNVLYLDFEHAFDVEHAKELGLDIYNNFYFVNPLNGEDAYNSIRDFVDSGEVGLVIMDSITALASKSAVEDAFSGFSGSKSAAINSSGIRLLLNYLNNNKCTLVIIAQERANVGGGLYGPDYKIATSEAPKFYASIIARISRTGDILGDNKDLIGIEIKVKASKNKVGINKRDAHMKLFFKGGFDTEDEYCDYLKMLGLLEQKGAYYSNAEWVADDGTVGMKVCGMEAVKEWLLKNPICYGKVKKQVNDLMLGRNVIDNNIDENSEEYEEPKFDPETGEILE